jgi:hypothetical protein
MAGEHMRRSMADDRFARIGVLDAVHPRLRAGGNDNGIRAF